MNDLQQPTDSMATNARLSIMMFLQFFIWGAWYVTGPNYLSTIGFGAEDFGWTYSVGPIAGMLSPFFVGMVADRFLPSQVVLGLLHLMGTAGMYLAMTLMKVENPDPTTINWVFFGYMLAYYPTLAVTNTVAMTHIANTEKTFPIIRVFGTLGWIAAGMAVSELAFDTKVDQFYLAIGASLAMAIYSFTLPSTPPPAKGKAFSAREALGLDALAMLRNRSFATFMLGSFLICIPLAFYYQMAQRFVEDAGVEKIGTTMSFGQWSEVGFMILLPLFLRKFGFKLTLLVGMLAWVVRYGLFAFAADEKVIPLILVGIVLHGICYDFFFVTGQIYTDKIAPSAIRGQAQGMLVLFTLGLGMFIGAQVAGRIEAAHTTEVAGAVAGEVDKVIAWGDLWLKPAGMAGAVMILFALLFSGKQADASA